MNFFKGEKCGPQDSRVRWFCNWLNNQLQTLCKRSNRLPGLSSIAWILRSLFSHLQISRTWENHIISLNFSLLACRKGINPNWDRHEVVKQKTPGQLAPREAGQVVPLSGRQLQWEAGNNPRGKGFWVRGESSGQHLAQKSLLFNRL